MRSVKDYVLIQVEKKTDNEYKVGEHTLYLYDGELNMGDYNPNSRLRIYGEVVAVPEMLTSDACDFGEKKLKDLPMEVKVGDRAYFYYIVFNADNIVFFEGKMYLRVRMDSVICVVRDGAIVPVSGHILLTRKKKVETALMYGVEKEAQLTAEVHYVSAPYLGDADLDFAPGDTVHYLKNCDFENTIEGVDYLCMRQEYILAKQEV